MSILRVAAYLAAGTLAVWLAAPRQASADEWNQKTVVTFSGPVEIPGQVLPAGTYVFKLADSQSDRNVVEVFNKNEDHLYGMFLAIPDYRMRPASKPIITFEERSAGAPEAIRAWFYPGENYGHDFVYPKRRAMELAKTSQKPVPSMPNELEANTTKPTTNMNEPNAMAMKKAPIKAQQPNQQEVETAEVFSPPPAPQTPQTSAQAQMPAKLPKTASPLPLIGLVGLLSLGVVASLRMVDAKMR